MWGEEAAEDRTILTVKGAQPVLAVVRSLDAGRHGVHYS